MGRFYLVVLANLAGSIALHEDEAINSERLATGMKRVTTDKIHRISGDGNPKITVTIGDGHLGTSIVLLDNKEIANGKISGVEIGEPGESLSGKTVTVRTMISAVQMNTKHTSATYRFGKPGEEKEYVVTEMIDDYGDPIIYETRIAMVD